VSLRPFDNASYNWTANHVSISSFAGPVTYSCWARFLTASTVTDEYIFGSQAWHCNRQITSNIIYSHVTESGSHSFSNNSAIGADPTVWHHICGVWDDVSNLNTSYVDASGASQGTTLNNNGQGGLILFAYDSQIELAHCAIWATAFTSTEVSLSRFVDPLLFKRDYLRAYWPFSRGARARNVAPGIPYGLADARVSGVSGVPEIITEDGPPTSANWERLDKPLIVHYSQQLALSVGYFDLPGIPVRA